MIRIIYITLYIILIGCTNSTSNVKSEIGISDKEGVHKDTITHVDTIRKSINAFKQFNYYGLQEQLLDPNTNPYNKNFIWKLLVTKNQDWLNANSKKLTERAILPVYRFSENSVGITTFQKFKKVGKNGWKPFTPEYELYLSIPTTATIEDSLLWYKRVRADTLLERSKRQPILGYSKMDSLNYNKGKEYYIYGTTRQSIGKIDNFGYYEDDCDFRFYTYLLANKEILSDLSFQPLIATKEPIDIEYLSDPEIDSILQKEYLISKGLSDCPARRDAIEKVFARLVDFPNVYFAYRDKFPYNTEIDYPGRTMLQVNKETRKVNRLWGASIDYFGCGCL